MCLYETRVVRTNRLTWHMPVTLSNGVYNNSNNLKRAIDPRDEIAFRRKLYGVRVIS